jgi:hypothetical protein
VFAGELGQHVTGDDFAPRLVLVRGEAAAVDPAAHRVVADAEQYGGVFDPDGRQSAFPSMFRNPVAIRVCGSSSLIEWAHTVACSTSFRNHG